MNRTMKAVIAGALLIPALGYAAEGTLNYNYLEAGYVSIDNDGPGGEGDGIDLRGSLAIAPNWHLFANIGQVNYGNDVDGNVYDIGFGYNHSLTGTTDLIGRLSWVKSDGDIGDDDGFSVQALVRSAIMPQVEVEGGLRYVDFGGENGDDTAVVAAGRYFFTPNFAAGLSLAASDDVKTYGVDVRWNFK